MSANFSPWYNKANTILPLLRSCAAVLKFPSTKHNAVRILKGSSTKRYFYINHLNLKIFKFRCSLGPSDQNELYHTPLLSKTRSSWLNCALRDDEAVYWVSMRRYQLVIDDTGSVEDIHAFIYCTKWRSGQVLPMPDRQTDWQLWKIGLLSSL